jgi:hypothetical protein
VGFRQRRISLGLTNPISRSKNMNIDTATITRPLSITVKFILAVLAFLIPFFIPSPQWLTGSLVNSLFFLFAFTNTNKKEILPYLILPSIGALANGLLFGSLTVFLFYLLPFIWISNLILITTAQNTKFKNYPARIILSSLSKYLFLYIAAIALFKLKLIPQLFLISMGSIQLFTAMAGGLLSVVLLKIINRTNE